MSKPSDGEAGDGDSGVWWPGADSMPGGTTFSPQAAEGKGDERPAAVGSGAVKAVTAAGAVPGLPPPPPPVPVSSPAHSPPQSVASARRSVSDADANVVGGSVERALAGVRGDAVVEERDDGADDAVGDAMAPPPPPLRGIGRSSPAPSAGRGPVGGRAGRSAAARERPRSTSAPPERPGGEDCLAVVPVDGSGADRSRGSDPHMSRRRALRRRWRGVCVPTPVRRSARPGLSGGTG